jgi:hypothetical protein
LSCDELRIYDKLEGPERSIFAFLDGTGLLFAFNGLLFFIGTYCTGFFACASLLAVSICYCFLEVTELWLSSFNIFDAFDFIFDFDAGTFRPLSEFLIDMLGLLCIELISLLSKQFLLGIFESL